MRGARAQTSIDFVVAAGVFLVAIAFVLGFVLSMFAPFFGMGATHALIGDRTAAYLAENALVDGGNASPVLAPAAVDDFFDDCHDASDQGDWLEDAVAVDSDRLNVSLEDAEGVPGETTTGNATVCGPVPDGSETVSNRIVSVNGTQHTLRVVVW